MFYIRYIALKEISMGFLADIKAAATTYNVATTGTANMAVGSGNALIESHSGNVNIMTEDGNHIIMAEATNLNVDTGCNGSDQVFGVAGNAWISTHDDDDSIVLNCDNLDLDIGNGNNYVAASVVGGLNIRGGDGNNTIFAESKNGNEMSNYITLRNGNNYISASGDRFGITTGDGNSMIGTVGDGQYIHAGNGNHTIGFYGSNISINLGNGNHDVRTMDNWIRTGNGEFSATATGFMGNTISLASSFDMRVSRFTEEGVLAGYMMNGVSNVNLTTGNGNLQGLVTIGDGNFTIQKGNQAEFNANINTGTSGMGGLPNFVAGQFSGMNKYYIPA